jgi:hypothetical protein
MPTPAEVQTQNNSEYRFNDDDHYQLKNPHSVQYLKPLKNQGTGLIEMRNVTNPQATADYCQDESLNHSKTKMTVGSLSITGLGMNQNDQNTMTHEQSTMAIILEGGIPGDILGTSKKEKPQHIGRTQRQSVKALTDLLHSEECKEGSPFQPSLVR